MKHNILLKRMEYLKCYVILVCWCLNANNLSSLPISLRPNYIFEMAAMPFPCNGLMLCRADFIWEIGDIYE